MIKAINLSTHKLSSNSKSVDNIVTVAYIKFESGNWMNYAYDAKKKTFIRACGFFNTVTPELPRVVTPEEMKNMICPMEEV